MVRIAVDMDEVIVDTFPALLDWYHEKYNYNISITDCIGKSFIDLFAPEHVETMEELLTDGAFFGALPVMNGAQTALKILSENFEIFLTTAAMEYPNSCEYKFRWLRDNMPFIDPLNIVFCGDKSIIHADYLIDDNVRHFKRFCGQGLLFTSPQNTMIEWTPRVNDWGEVLEFFGVNKNQ
ncbi:5'-3'-deoxyribonucleotidase [Brenneria populi subsp. brevivirga]|uniref:5' nucleotidase, NT5C type n=1 Tax=Brenneria populi TaxID=1505588 RepID=UPI002E1986E0|nr:5'-3'-deoxyribonucleotidase [Brenneria populi subsp. brevivirga]